MTENDIKLLNTRVVGKNGVTLPDDGPDADTTYACPLNKQCNAASAGIFQQHLSSGDFPTVDSDDLPPDHTIIIEAGVQISTPEKGKGNTRVNQEYQD